jgi:hypothetical protein
LATQVRGHVAHDTKGWSLSVRIVLMFIICTAMLFNCKKYEGIF